MERRGVYWLTILLVLVLAVSGVKLGAEEKGEENVQNNKNINYEECRGKGFTENLMCSRCEQLSTFVNDSEIISDCFSCCTNDSNTDMLYSFAVLQVNANYLWMFPQINTFIDGKAAKYVNLEVEYPTFGVVPTLVFYNEHKEIVDTVQIDRWRLDTITDFLDQKLMKELQIVKEKKANN
eukprot:TRINITY_DN10768_c0_g1_i1.p1 TRINITY_DN10768_c0_g1~~TRINITY_DN10768_c0_g1_i1.p1  ORF type:complete len:180 (+),score=40.71 TRINITY_DN10768_c0_g1_i1:14-553(+)